MVRVTIVDVNGKRWVSDRFDADIAILGGAFSDWRNLAHIELVRNGSSIFINPQNVIAGWWDEA